MFPVRARAVHPQIREAAASSAVAGAAKAPAAPTADTPEVDVTDPAGSVAAAPPPPPSTGAGKQSARAKAKPTRHALFDDFYSLSTLTSFDELLARPYLHAPASAPKAPPPPTPPPRDESPPSTERTYEGRDAPPGWLQIGADGTCIDHPLWKQAVTWEGNMGYRSFHETLEVSPLGGGVQALLPKGYVECDAMLEAAQSQLESAEAESEGEAIYARFTGDIAPPSEAALRYYTKWASVDGGLEGR